LPVAIGRGERVQRGSRETIEEGRSEAGRKEHSYRIRRQRRSLVQSLGKRD